jgi:NAD(P)-dependent dehydrogenase (short-subunit alcohol dehydrogenase family)
MPSVRSLQVGARAELPVAADLADPAVADQTVAKTIARFGRLEVPVNNAGGAAPRPFVQTTREQLDEAFDFNRNAAADQLGLIATMAMGLVVFF